MREDPFSYHHDGNLWKHAQIIRRFLDGKEDYANLGSEKP